MNTPLPFRRFARLGCLLLLLGLYLPAWAQVDLYTFAASTATYTPNPTTATNVPTILGDDVVSSPIMLPFAFAFDGLNHNSIKVSSNGFISFNTTAGSNLGNNLSAGASTEYPLIAPFWDDLNGNNTGARASYFTAGAAPNRVFTFEWLNWYRFGQTGPSFSMQVKLYETSNRIELIYRQESAPLGTADASIGLSGEATMSGSTASSFLSVQNTSSAPTVSSVTANNAISSLPATGQVYAFTPPPSTGCLPPRGLAVADITGNSATIDFRGSASTTSFTVTYQATGGPVQTITPNPTAGPIYLVGLLMNTTYAVTVTANCSGGTTSTVTTTFTTSNGYCSGLGGNCNGANITQVRVANTSLNASNLTCATSGGAAYTNYPASGATTATLLRGVSYVLTAATSTSSSVSAWIDFNHNFAFEANEYVPVYAGTTGGTVNFLVPTTGSTYTGPTVMRVRSTTSTLSSSSACANLSSGETKDFNITIGAAPSCLPPSNLTATNITATSAQLSFTTPSAGGSYTIVYGPVGVNPNSPGTTGGTVLSNATSPTAVSGLSPGTGYEFYVQRNCGNGDLSVFTGPFAFTTSIVNINPCSAIVLRVNASCVPFSSTTVGATTYTAPGLTTTGCSGFNSTPRAVWFSFTTGAVGTAIENSVRITVDGAAASQVQVFGAADCTGPFNNLGCAGTATNVPAGNLDVRGLTPNTTYFVRVFNYSNSTTPSAFGPFTICAAPIPNCAEPVALGATNITSTSATLTWASQNSPTNSFLVRYGTGTFNPQNGGTLVGPVSTPSTQLTNLTANTNYCFYVQRNCGGFNGSSIWSGPYCFSTLFGTPANDDPCSAVVLSAGASTTANGTTVGATTSTQNGISAGACSPARQPTDVWYTMTPAPGSNSLTLNLQGAAAGVVRVFTASSCANGPFTQVYCQSAGAANTGFNGPLTVTGLIPGERYYVSVAGYTSADTPGAFTLTLGPLGVLSSRAQTESAALQVYPNPSNTGQLSFRLSHHTQAGEALLLNALGQTVATKTVSTGTAENTLSTRGLAAGLYTLRVRVAGEVFTRKVVLE